MPTTSSESSKPSFHFSPTASAQTAPATTPSSSAQPGVRLAHAGVIATRAATAPEAAPTDVGLPSLSFSTSSQAQIEAAVAPIVLSVMSPALPSPFSHSAPTLKPNQPNHRML